jgi:SAM-dependent methyltransferase
MSWDEQYGQQGQVWGEGPGELALFLVGNRQRLGLPEGPVDILDIGCGYGRDALYIAESIPCRIMGIDTSATAVAMAGELAGRKPGWNVEFRCCDFGDVAGSDYDVVFMSNLYHILRPDERRRLREAVRAVLRPGGLLLVCTLSVNDPEHEGKGEPVENEPNSFVDEKYVHLCTREELEADFDFIEIGELFEREYAEPRAGGEHHHISWILSGRHRVRD